MSEALQLIGMFACVYAVAWVIVRYCFGYIEGR